MELNFKDNMYKEKALKAKLSPKDIHSSEDALLLLIRGVSFEDLSNLCELIKDYYASLESPIDLSLEQCYKLTQSNDLSNLEKNNIANLISKCIQEKGFLGNKTINDERRNSSGWISHSFYAGEVCAILANKLGLDEDKARTLGLLHDYGRKFNHSFKHTIIGFEELTDLGWDNEAIGCLTHSFVNGGRCSNNERAIDGFYVDKDGIAKWKKGTIKDDMTIFLENYKYSDYDILLNIADLMATNKGIVSPKVRISDIATRRIIDPINRGYFLADITNVFIEILKRFNLVSDYITHIKHDELTSLHQIAEYFEIVSDYFYLEFSKLKKDQKNNIKR